MLLKEHNGSRKTRGGQHGWETFSKCWFVALVNWSKVSISSTVRFVDCCFSFKHHEVQHDYTKRWNREISLPCKRSGPFRLERFVRGAVVSEKSRNDKRTENVAEGSVSTQLFAFMTPTSSNFSGRANAYARVWLTATFLALLAGWISFLPEKNERDAIPGDSRCANDASVIYSRGQRKLCNSLTIY